MRSLCNHLLPYHSHQHCSECSHSMLHINLDWGTYPLLDILICEIKKKYMWEDLLILIYCIYFIPPLNYLLTFQPLHTRLPRASGERSVYIYISYYCTLQSGKKICDKKFTVTIYIYQASIGWQVWQGTLDIQSCFKGFNLNFQEGARSGFGHLRKIRNLDKRYLITNSKV